jgi:hypothetical protein
MLLDSQRAQLLANWKRGIELANAEKKKLNE